MPDDQDQQYKPWLRDSGRAGGNGVPKPAHSVDAKSAGVPATPRRDVRALSADELLARPAPLPTDAPAAPGTGERVRSGLDKVATGLRAANERIEPARRAREAGAAVAKAAGAALRSTRKAAGTLGSATAEAAGRAAEVAAPKLQEAAEAAKAGLSKTAASAREGLSKGGKAARAGIGAGAANAREAVKAAIPERPAPATPPSELDRLVEREGLDERVASTMPAPASPGGLPLFGARAEAATAAPAPARPAAEAQPAAASAVAPSAPLAEALQAEEDEAPQPTSWTSRSPVLPAGSLGQWARHPATWALAALALLASGFAAGRWTGGGAMSEAALGAAIDAHLLANPEIVPQAMERLQATRQAAAIAENRTALTTPFSGAWAGDAAGDVTLVVFTDYACTFCRASMPDIERLLRTDRNLKIVFRELPILSADSEAAARVALASARRGRYMPVHRTLFRSPVPDATARAGALAATGVELPAGATADPAIDRELSGNVDLARALGINGTPAFVVGDQLIVGAAGYERLRTAIADARS